MLMRSRRLRYFLVIAALAAGSIARNPVAAQDQFVTWQNLVNASAGAAGTILQKTGGCDGCGDAGASSLQQLPAGGGFVEFTVGESGTFWIAGLTTEPAGTDYGDIDFAFRFNGSGWADILENGDYRPGGDTPYAPGDVYRIAVVNGRVQYSRNGRFIAESARTPEYPLVLDATLFSAGATVRDAKIGALEPPPPGGGLLEKSGSPGLRARFRAAQIAAFLPAGGATGPFRFPSPYNTDAVRLTNSATCGGADCVHYVGYSYWRNSNNHVGSAHMFILLGTSVNRGGRGPVLIRYDKATDAVTDMGPLFPAGSPYSFSTAEGWYFSARRATRLYVHLPGSPLLRRFDIGTRRFEAAPAIDLARCPQPTVCPANAAYIAQPHSSDDDAAHSATVQNASWERIGCVVRRGASYYYFPRTANYAFDECHIDKSGRWLVILESAPSGARINRVVNVRTGAATTIQDTAGALGHLDVGHGYAVGADTFNPLPNATILLKFPVPSTARPIGPVVHYNKRWDIAAANHVAHGNARAGTAAEDQYACGSNASRVPDMADEIVCFPLDAQRNADGSLDVLVLGQVLTDLNAAGGSDGSGSDYPKMPKGNLDVTGRYFIWTSNAGCARLDSFLVKVPAERLAP